MNAGQLDCWIVMMVQTSHLYEPRRGGTRRPCCTDPVTWGQGIGDRTDHAPVPLHNVALRSEANERAWWVSRLSETRQGIASCFHCVVTRGLSWVTEMVALPGYCTMSRDPDEILIVRLKERLAVTD